MQKQIKAVLLGAGNRANVYAKTALAHPDRLQIVGIVDPDPVRRELMREKYGVSSARCYENVEAFVAEEKFADAVINGTMDHLHVPTSIPVLEKGYDLLLEKPFAVNEAEARELCRVAKENGSRVVIGHVLRYTDFYRAIKEQLLSGAIGEIISIESCEHVNYHHMAVSFVRGKWRSEKICFAPMLLAKSCHDIDIMVWMMGDNSPVRVSSFGSDLQFGKERKPAGAGTRCTADCPLEGECIFSARANYLAADRWKQYVWKPLEGEGELTPERKARSLRTDNPYGKCVWDFERDGNVDHQTVNIQFANGATGSFTMVGGSAKSERNIHIVGTRGEIKGTFEDGRFVMRRMLPSTKAGYEEEVFDLNVSDDMIGARGGHGGGDRNLVLDFLDYLNGGEPSVCCATLEDSLRSHLVAYAADRARKNGSVEQL